MGPICNSIDPYKRQEEVRWKRKRQHDHRDRDWGDATTSQ